MIGIKDDKLQWILAAKDEDINDGLTEEMDSRERFLKEANPNEFDIEEYIIELENALARYSKHWLYKLMSLFSKESKTKDI